MKYAECEKILQSSNIYSSIEKDLLTEIDEIFIASSDSKEMKADLLMINENEYEHSEIMLNSKKADYSIYILDTKNIIIKIKEDFFS